MPRRAQDPQDPPPVGYAQRLRIRAESGDMSALIDYMCGPARSTMLPESRERLIRKCIESASENGPAGLVDNLLNHQLQHDTRLLIRAQIAARALEDTSDDSFIAVRPPGERLVQAWERAGRLADRVLSLAQVRGKLKHLDSMSSQESKTQRRSEKIIDLPPRSSVQEAASV